MATGLASVLSEGDQIEVTSKYEYIFEQRDTCIERKKTRIGQLVVVQIG